MGNKNSGRRPCSDLNYILNFFYFTLFSSSHAEVARAMDTSWTNLRNKIEKSKDLQLAREIAEQKKKALQKQETLGGYILERLSPEAQASWNQLDFWEANWEETDKILATKTKRVRQELFVHALVTGGFDVSSACRKTAVSRKLLFQWQQDPEFRAMLEEIEWHKKNFFEAALTDLVQQRNPGAVIFVNKTKNADRGYREQMDVHHSGAIEGTLDIDQLELDIDTRKKLLEAIRKKKEQLKVEAAKDVTPQAVKQITGYDTNTTAEGD